MKTRSLSLFCLLAAACAILAACAATSNVVSLGDNTYALTREGGSSFSRDTSTLRQQAITDAAKFCTDKGKQMKIVTVAEQKPMFYTQDFPRVKVVFKALDAGDPAFKSEPTPLTGAIDGSKTDSGDFYTELLKLDDLHKRGILTDKEFESAKKRILANAK